MKGWSKVISYSPVLTRFAVKPLPRITLPASSTSPAMLTDMVTLRATRAIALLLSFAAVIAPSAKAMQ